MRRGWRSNFIWCYIFLGVAGLSGSGIMSGLAALGGIVGGGAAAGIFVAAAPVAILGLEDMQFLTILRIKN